MGEGQGEYGVPDGVLFNDVAGEAVLLNLDTGQYYALNQAGARLWHLLLEHRRLEPVLERMLAEYEVAPEQLRDDVDALLEELLERRLLVRTP